MHGFASCFRNHASDQMAPGSQEDIIYTHKLISTYCPLYKGEQLRRGTRWLDGPC